MTDTNAQAHRLVELKETSLALESEADDIRGRDVLDRGGDKIGKVDDLMIDQDDQQIRFLKVAHGGFLGIGEDHYLIPAAVVTKVTPDAVTVDRAKADLGNAPGYNPSLVAEENYLPDVYGYWETTPYWSPGYLGSGAIGFPTIPVIPGR